ncbi:hypothetical protein [Embleya hyalina]|uniref:N-acetyltransferase domain-containing protein n=1 Tax=Embleya hyalina TaxID=516124 RepID=A0A401YUY6_9ACTN|nr:hypothetical protein [Embleya hyalina]GCD98386.1 hypothetical protein EHYA_06093 [Embleya hyalina]
MTLTVERVGSRRALRDFCALPMRLHPRERYVPVPRDQVRRWARAGIELYLVRDRAGRVVGRTCTHTEARFDAKLGGRHQLFGLTEFAEDPAVFARLVELIEERAARAGADSLFGPVALLPNQTGGVITSGFTERGFVDSAWNPARYPETYERAGFARRFSASTWICPGLTERVDDPAATYVFDDARIAAEQLVIRRGSRRRLAEQLPILHTMLNASFAQLGYYTPITLDELRAQTDGLAYLLDESLLLWLERAGEPVAFTLAVPDISEFLIRIRGDLHPGNRVRLLATRGRYRREAVLIIKGTVPGAQGRGYLTLLAREQYRALRAGGYDTLRSTWVEDDNGASAAQYRRIGGRELHGHTFYAKPVGSAR